MDAAVLKESKLDQKKREVENRVILTPTLVQKLKAACPEINILVESRAGEKIGFKDKDYKDAGARIVNRHKALSANLILGVKETRLEDFPRLKNNIFMSYQHFAESPERVKAALKTKATFICLETMEEEKNGRRHFPCLAPMSEAAARILTRHADLYALLSRKIIGSGLSMTGFKKLKVVVLGAGTVGRTAAKEFTARGYEVHLLDRGNLKLLEPALKGAFFAVSAMYTSGKSPEKLITLELLNNMAEGGCVYPVDIDQGGGIEGALQTSILDLFELPRIEGTNISCFAPPNIPSLGARTTSEALGEAVLPYVIKILKDGLDLASQDLTIKSGINIQKGRMIHPGLKSCFPSLD